MKRRRPSFLLLSLPSILDRSQLWMRARSHSRRDLSAIEIMSSFPAAAPLYLGLTRCAAVLTAAILLLQPASPTANLCSTQGLCCKHRDSNCVVQNVLQNHSVDTSALPCYCDHACLKLDDCCIDYQEFCSGKREHR